MKKRRAVVVGLDYHAQFLADLINEHAQHWHVRAYDSSRIGTVRSLLAMRTADVLISFGGPAPNIALVEAARYRNIPIVVIWAGSDVIKAQEDPFELELIKQEHFSHLAVGQWLVDELSALGVQAEYEPVTGIAAGRAPRPLPRTFRVLTYLPESRRGFYGESVVYEAARAMPNVRFDVVGEGERSTNAPSNVVFHGFVGNTSDRLDETVVLLRHPEHDGKSMFVLEALARARHVVWNYDFPHVHTARGAQEVIKTLRELEALHKTGKLEPNNAGREYVLRTFPRREVARSFERRLDDVVRAQAQHALRPAHRVAISGLGLFCAHVANHAAHVAPEWETRLLRTSSRLEVLTSIVTLMYSDVWYSIGSPVTDRWVHLAARLMRKPRVVHWVGSDIDSLRENPHLRALLSSPRTMHLAEVTWTAEQLREFGLDPRIAPLPPRHAGSQCVPLPQRFTVMLYVPRTRADFYGRPAFERLMQRLAGRNIRYFIVGGGSISAPPGEDVVNLGWRDNLYDVYKDVTMLIRYTPHDGLSLMVLEALSFGRHVLWTQAFPFVRTIRSYADMESTVRELHELHEQGRLQTQQAASALIGQDFASDTCVRRIVHAWDDALRSGSPPQLVVEVQ